MWVFNRADIDASRIVWVDSMKPEENRRVLDYYGQRRTTWMLDDDAELTLRPYGRPTAGATIRIKNPPLPEWFIRDIQSYEVKAEDPDP